MSDPVPTATSTTTTTKTGAAAVTPVASAVDPIVIVPAPLTGLASVLKHLKDWAEMYVWVPVSIFGIILFAKFAYFLTGRKPLDQGYDFVGLGVKLSVCVFLILLLSIAKQALDVWPTKAEQVQHVKHLIWAQRILTIVLSIVFAWIIVH